MQLSCSVAGGALAPTYQIVSGPGHGSLSGFDPYSGAVTYTPAAGFFGTDSFTYQGADEGASSSVRTVTVTVAAPPPSCQPVSASTGEGQTVAVSLSCSDAAGAALSYAIDSQPSYGFLGALDEATGMLTFTPSAGFTGTDTFTYHASSTNGTSSSQTVSVAVNPPPSCENTFLTTAAGQAATAGLSCADQSGASVTYAIVSGPTHGSLGILHQSTGQVSYTPDAGFSGSDSFTYRASSANGTSNTATAQITVNPPPVCQSLSVATGESYLAVVALNCADQTGASVTYAIVSGPTHGSLGSIQQPGGAETYTPTGGFTGSDNFTYRRRAPRTSNTATVQITVEPRPTCRNMSATTGQSVPVVVALGCTDPTGHR